MCEEPKTPFPYDECGWDYIDDTSGKLLNNTLVEKARPEEISVICELGVWEVVDRLRDRSRLVVQEYKRQADWSFFTAPPPLEALRSLLICATIDELPNELGQPFAWTGPVILMLIDVRREHFYSPARRKVFVELLEEAGTDKSQVGRLLGSMYGCRDAGVNWEPAICQVMIAIGFVQGRASPCTYRHLERQLRCVQSIRVLGRIVEWTANGITWRADPRHAELIRKSFGVTSRSVTTPGVSDKLTDIEGEVPIDKEAPDRYRANTMRAQYLSSDRPDIQIECRDRARKMQQPSNLDEMGLKRLAFFSECVRGWFGCPRGRNVSHESNPGVIQTMQAVSELGRVFLVVR